MTESDLLLAAARAAGIALWDWAVGPARLTMSRGWAEMLGYPEGTPPPSADDWASWVHPDDRASLQREGAGYIAANTGEFCTVVRIAAASGAWRWVEARARLEVRSDGPHLVGGVLDVTDRERARADLARHTRALRLLTDANQALVRARDETTLLNDVCRIAVEVGSYRMAWVGLIEPGPGRVVHPVAQAGFDEGYVAASEAVWTSDRSPVAIALATGRPYVVRDIPTDPAFVDRREVAAARGYRSAAALPVVSAGQALAVLKVYSPEPDAFDEGELAILRELADDLGVGIASSRVAAERDRAVRELRTVIDSLPDPIVRFDRDGRLAYVGAAVRHIDDRAPATLVGRTIPELEVCADRADDERLVASLRRVIAGGGTEQLEVQMGAPGASRPFEVRHVPVLDDHGAVTGVVAIARDLTERRAAERQLYLLNFALDAIGDGIFLMVGDSPRFAYVNQAAADSLGYTRAELTERMSLFDIDPHMTPQAWEQLVAVMRDRHRMTIESEHQARDGRRFPIEVTGNYFEFDGAMHNLAIVRDLTERRAAESARRATERQLQTITTAIDDVFWLADAQRSAFTFVSPAYERVFGCGETCGAPTVPTWDRHIDAADLPRVQAAVADLPDVPYDVEYRIRRCDGGIRWIHDRAVPIRDASGRIEQLAGVAADVTRRHALEEQLSHAQKLEAVGQLAGGIAHDFNNMLTVVQMQATLLRDPRSDPAHLRAGLDEIIAATDRAANLTRQLLTFSRRQVAQPVDLDLADTLGAMLKLLRRVLGEHITLETRFAARLPVVHADRGMMEQVLMNLAINARDAMPAGGRLEVSLAPVDVDAERAARAPGAAPGRHVALTVTDTGTGIAAEHLPRIFEPFFTTKEVGKGTGLGLATVFGIVTQHHGAIEVTSTPGVGTSFTVLLPAVGREVAATAEEAAPAAQVGGRETLLLVEDDTGVRAATRAALETLGYQVLEAGSGSAALAIWAAVGASVALVITDLVMPGGMSGSQLVDILRAQRPDLRIVYTSGYSPDVIDQRLALGPTSRFIAKPYTREAIAACVRACLDADR